MGFDAGTVEGLDVRGLAKYGIDDQTIAEPSNRQLRAFGRYLKRVFDGVESGDMARRYAEAVASADGDEDKAEAAQAAIDADLYEAAAAVCSDVPSAAQLEALPPRLFREWFNWLRGELTDPTVSKPATTPSLTVVRDEQNVS